MRTRSTVTNFARIAAIFAVVASLLIMPLHGLADDGAATPGAVAVACETAPIDEVRYAEAAADTGDDVPIPGAIPYVPPVGEAAPPATVERVKALVGQVVACVNEGRNGAFLSLFTADFLARHLSEMGDDPDDEAPTPVDADMRLSLIRVADVAVLGDGRVAALVVLDQVEREAPELTSLLTFRELAGRLLIDAWQPVTLTEDDAPPSPVPCGRDASPAPGCLPPPISTAVAEQWELVSGPGYTGVIAPLDQAPIFRFGYGDRASGWWLPTGDEIDALEAGLPAYLAGADDARARGLAPKVDTYLRQYAGLVIEGRALIFVNALCEDVTDGGWTSEPVFVDDGGDCFFQVYWEPVTGEFRELAINGEG